MLDCCLFYAHPQFSRWDASQLFHPESLLWLEKEMPDLEISYTTRVSDEGMPQIPDIESRLRFPSLMSLRFDKSLGKLDHHIIVNILRENPQLKS